MKEIHSGLVLDVAPSTGGFVFAAQQDSTEDGRAIVEYKTCDFVSRKLENITRNLYLLTKFGDLYERYADHPQQYLTSMTAFFPNGDLLLVEADGSARRLTQQGHCVYEGQFLYHGDAPSAVAVANGFVWVRMGFGSRAISSLSAARTAAELYKSICATFTWRIIICSPSRSTLL